MEVYFYKLFKFCKLLLLMKEFLSIDFVVLCYYLWENGFIIKCLKIKIIKKLYELF